MQSPGFSVRMADRELHAEDSELLEELRRAILGAEGRVVRIEAGIALSIALGRERTPTSCGGCSVPLSFEGIPASTEPAVSGHFRLILSAAPATGAAASPETSERGWAGSSP
ncbi:MAG: hypothetical protein ACYDFT_03120 [Thermoplasmata archaeon]